MIFTTLLIFSVILSILVLVHELGHFLVAKIFGVRVEEFGLGLPPRLFGFSFGETVYSLNLLPIGGFVKLAGEEGGQGKVGEFNSQKSLVKTSIVMAGVLMNLIFGFSLLSLGIAKIGMPEISTHFEITKVVKDSPAQIAGILPNDEIVSIDNQGFKNAETLTDLIKNKAGEKTAITVLRMKKSFTYEIVPRKNPPAGEGALGVTFASNAQVTYKRIPLQNVPVKGFEESVNLVGMMFGGLKSMLKEAILQRTVPQDVAGPVGIAKITATVAKGGLWQIINFMALLSFNLGVINMLPFPGLDGGRFLFVILEKVLGQRFNLGLQTFINSVGIAILLLLMAIITYFDIVRSF